MRPPEVVKRELVKQWLAKAEGDLAVAAHLLSQNPPFNLDAIGFHAQQAAEKFLKALLVRHQIEFPKTHNLGELLDLVKQADLPLATFLQDITVLNPFAIDFRYPGDFPVITPEEANIAVNLAKKVQRAVLASLEGSL